MQVLLAALVATVLLGVLRATALLRESLAAPQPKPGRDQEKPADVAASVFATAAANLLAKVATATSHGLLAIKWVLAGDEAGLPLVACLSLVAVNTELLVTVTLMVHMRRVLTSLATCRGYRIDFQRIGSLVNTNLGLSCLLWNATVASVLVLHIFQGSMELWRVLPWVATAAGTLIWANSTFSGIGATEWAAMEGFATKNTPVVTIPEFLLFLEAGGSSTEVDRQPEPGISSRFAQGWAKAWTLSPEDMLLQQRWRTVLHAAFPHRVRMQILHAAVVARVVIRIFCSFYRTSYCMFNLPSTTAVSDTSLVVFLVAFEVAFFKMLTFVLPMSLVIYSLFQIPQIRAIEPG